MRLFEQACHEKQKLTCAGAALAKTYAEGALHHSIVRGIERRKIFWDDEDRDSLVKRLGQVLTETHTDCFAWDLIPNHLLPCTGLTPISVVMRRLLTGYTAYILSLFGRKISLARSSYSEFAVKGVSDGVRPELANLLSLDQQIVTRRGRYPDTVKARSVLCYWAARGLGISTLALSKRLGISQPTASQSVKRSEKIVKEKNSSCWDELCQYINTRAQCFIK